jgi:hypothetical protein
MLTGQQYEKLLNFFSTAFQGFTAPFDLAEMLRFRLNRDLGNITLAVPGSNIRQIAFEVIGAAEREGWTEDLIAAAQDFRPRNKQIAALADELGLGGERLAKAALESIVKESGSVFLDVDDFYEMYGIRRTQVCRIEYPVPNGTEYGTGFLVGASQVMTARHVVAKGIEAKLSGSRLICRFDYKRLPSGKILDGTIYHPIDDNWLAMERRHARSDEGGDGQPNLNELDYAVLRIDKEAGLDVVGRGNASGGGGVEERSARRGWIKLSEHPPATKIGETVLLLQHPESKPMQLSMGKILAESDLRVRHDARSLGGSSGSPCFNAKLEVVAMHQAGDPLHSKLRGDYNQAIPMAKIVDDLKRQGIEPFWEQEPPALQT